MSNFEDIKYSVLYRNGRDLVLFDFIATDDVDDLRDLIIFHFEERHDFEERIEYAVCVFENFYSDGSDIELIDWKKNNTD